MYYALQFSDSFPYICYYILYAFASHRCRPAIFSSASQEVVNEVPGSDLLHEDNEVDSSDDDGLPPLEANMNRTRPADLQSDTDSESNSTP